MASDGCTEAEIRASLALADDALIDPAARDRFRALIELGHLQLQARLRGDLLRIARRGTRGRSVVAALALARHFLMLGKPERPGANAAPNQESAVAEVERVLNKIFRNTPRCPTCGARQQRNKGDVPR